MFGVIGRPLKGPVVRDRGRSGAARTACFHKEKRLVVFPYNAFNPIQLPVPVIDRIIAAGADQIEIIPPADVILLIFVAVIGNKTAVYLSYFRDEVAPFGLAPVGLHHFTTDAEHLATGLFGDLRKMENIIAVGGEPVGPFRFARHVFIKEVDMRPPSAVGTIDDGL
ncbi:hypothetical protein D3C73_1279980 [compost metagenome]